MKSLLFLILLTVVQQFLHANEKAVVIDIKEFANFKEIQQKSAAYAVKKIKSQFGSRFPLKYLNSKMDGTALFPTYSNIKKVLAEKSTKKFIFISTHIELDNREVILACADSKKGDSVRFIKNVDFNGIPSMIIIHSPEIDKKTSAAFIESFKNINGFAILTNNEPDLDFYVNLYESPIGSWKEVILSKARNGLLVTGKAAAISDKEIAEQKKACDAAKLDAEKAGSAELASASFSAASMKMQLLVKRSPQDKKLAYFSWKEATDSFYKSRSQALSEKFRKDCHELKFETLKNYGHPRWNEMTSLINESEKEFTAGFYKSSGNKTSKASTLLKEIYKDITTNLLDLIKQSEKDGKSNSTQGLIKSLISLKPELKLQYAFQGQSFTNKAGIKFVFIPSGKFTMGSPKSEAGHEGDEKQHVVKITRGFYMSVTEITENQWRQVMGLNYLSDQKVSSNDTNNYSIGSNYPQRVSWREAKKFCQLLSENEKLNYRLPTEAEWEYAARAGSTTSYSSGDILTPDNAITKESRKQNAPSPCGTTKANAWGLFDMHGNLWEWCSDWSYIYENKAQVDPQGPSEKFAREGELDMKVVRGGSYDDPAIKARSANRWEYSPSVTSKIIGFRIVLELQDKDK